MTATAELKKTIALAPTDMLSRELERRTKRMSVLAGKRAELDAEIKQLGGKVPPPLEPSFRKKPTRGLRRQPLVEVPTLEVPPPVAEFSGRDVSKDGETLEEMTVDVGSVHPMDADWPSPASVSDASPKTNGKPRGRVPRLAPMIAAVLAKSLEPMGPKEITEKVIAAGWESKAKEPYSVVAQTLRNGDFVKVARGKWTGRID